MILKLNYSTITKFFINKYSIIETNNDLKNLNSNRTYTLNQAIKYLSKDNINIFDLSLSKQYVLEDRNNSWWYKWCLNYESGEYEYIDRDGFSWDRGEYVYNWDDSEYKREEKDEKKRRSQEEDDDF